jgi:GH24 family phage-related lysozyme (muramidase)
MRAVPESAVSFVADHEGRRLVAYQDVAGVWTIGYGHTGPDVHAGLKIDIAEARRLLEQDMKTAAYRLQSVVKPDVIAELTENQYAALLSFVFNLGANRKWGIWKLLNQRHFAQVPSKLQEYVNAGSPPKRIQGLVNRRAEEAKLWSLGAPNTVAEKLPSSFTRAEETPPTPSEPKPAAKSAVIITAVSGAVASAPPAINQAMMAVQPYAQHSEWMQRTLGVLATIGGALAILGLVLLFLKHKAARQ